MGQTQNKEGPPKKTKADRKTLKGRSNSVGNQHAIDTNFTLPWDMRGGQPEDPGKKEDDITDFMKSRPLPGIPPEKESTPNHDASKETFDFTDVDESELYYVIHNYDSNGQDGLLTITKGETVRFISFKTENKDWIEVKKRTGEYGWIPFNFVILSTSMDRFDWYHGKISRDRAEYYLNSGINGSFLMRESESAPGQHSLSLRYDGRVYHYRVFFDDANNVYVREEAKFRTLEELVAYHSREPGGLVTNLRHPAPKLDKPSVYSFSDEWEIARTEILMGQKLGGGQYGEVYKAEYKKLIGKAETRETVAVKTLKEDQTDTEEFMKEANMMKTLRHQNLVRLIGLCTRESPIYIVTEYMPKGNLLEFLRLADKSDLPATTLLYMASQVASAMKYLESKGVIHRDLAARNCLVGEHHTIKVADFGLARLMSNDCYKAHTGAKFPIKWTSPEALAYNKFSCKSDVWAFGVLMWEIANYGASPYPGHDLNEVYGLLEQGNRMQCPEGCPSAAYELMLLCWQWNANDRPTFADICIQLETMFDSTTIDDEVQRAIKDRPKSTFVSEVEGMIILPPKPPKRRANHDSPETRQKSIDKVLPEPPANDKHQLPKKEKKEKKGGSLLPMFRNTLRGKDKKSLENLVKASQKGSTENILSASDEHSLPEPLKTLTTPKSPSRLTSSPPPPPLSAGMMMGSSKISLMELQGGINTLKHAAPPPAVQNKPREERREEDELLKKSEKIRTRRQSASIVRPPTRTGGGLPKTSRQENETTVVKVPLLPNSIPKSKSVSPKISRQDNGSLPFSKPLPTPVASEESEVPSTNSVPSKPAKPIPPMRPSLQSTNTTETVKNSPDPPTKPEARRSISNKPKPPLKPRPTLVPRLPKQPDNQTPKRTYTLETNTENLKPELTDIFAIMQNVHTSVRTLIELADARQSENIAVKSVAAADECTQLVDKLSLYRDSIGPAARLKVNRHLAVMENNVNDFQNNAANLPRIATATDLEKMRKILLLLCDTLTALSQALPSL